MAKLDLFDEKPGSRISHFHCKFGKQTSKTLHYCEQCMSKNECYFYESTGLKYSINKKYRFKFVNVLDQEMDRRRKSRMDKIRRSHGTDFAAKGNCGVYVCGKYLVDPVLPKSLPRNRPMFIRKPPVFNIRITQQSLHNLIKGTSPCLEPIDDRELYSNDDYLCYLLDNKHSFRHQYMHTRQDYQGGAIATALYGQEIVDCGLSIRRKNRNSGQEHIWFHAGKTGPEWCAHGKKRTKVYKKKKHSKKKQNRKQNSFEKWFDLV